MYAPLLLTLLFVVIGWFLLIRPQQQRIRDQRELVASLQTGDRVVTAGGIHGTLTEVADDTVRIEVAPGVELTVARAAISRRPDAGNTAAGDGVTDAGSTASPTGPDVEGMPS